jgi:hypothetical protein
VPVVLTNSPAVVALTLTVNVQVVFTGTVAPLIETLVAPGVGANVLPVGQLFVASGEEFTSMPAGNESVTATSVKAIVFAAGLVMAIVKVEMPLTATEEGANALAICGGAITVKVAVLLVSPATGVSAVVTPEVVFGCSPAVALVTGKLTAQLELAGIVMPLKLKFVAPADKFAGVIPAQLPPVAPPTAVIFVKTSVNEAFVRLTGLLLLKVSVTVDCPPEAIETGENDLPIAGGARTVKLAVAAVPAPLLAVVTVLVVLVFNPALAPVTVTLNVQFVPAASEGFVNEMMFDEIE